MGKLRSNETKERYFLHYNGENPKNVPKVPLAGIRSEIPFHLVQIRALLHWEAEIRAEDIQPCGHGIVVRTKCVIMERDIYEGKWKLGPFAKKKDDLKATGTLG